MKKRLEVKMIEYDHKIITKNQCFINFYQNLNKYNIYHYVIN